ncbi:hypothetical protein GCM10020256_48070 [Streptomyces thermocoprophilus]
MTARSFANQPSTTSPSEIRASGGVASMVTIRSSPLVRRVGAPEMVITGVPLLSPSTFAVIPGCASTNGSGAKAAVAIRAATGRPQTARAWGA